MLRECQPCTACCDGWVKIEVKGCEAYSGYPCPHSTGKGCDDYENRPVNPCRKFECEWVKESSYLPDWFKPSECGALVIDSVIYWQGLAVDLAVPVGREIPEQTLMWLMQFAEQNMRPLIYQMQDPESKVIEKNPLTLAYGPRLFKIGFCNSSGQEIDCGSCGAFAPKKRVNNLFCEFNVTQLFVCLFHNLMK